MIQDSINNVKFTSSKAALLNSFIENGEQTIAELSEYLEVSVPYTTKILKELVDEGLVGVTGKKENYAKRAPKIYGLIATSGYFLGIDAGKQSYTLGICDFCGNIVTKPERMDIEYENSPEYLARLLEFTNDHINRSGIERKMIKMGCMSIGGRVNPITGSAFSFLTFLDKPLAEELTERMGIPFCIDNDTRCMTYGEFLKGVCKGLKDVIFVNVSWGIGIGIIFDGRLYLGRSGFSGEIGHMHIYNNGIICHCGKTGCMETETSGSAIVRKLRQALKDGATSVLSKKITDENQEITLQDFLNAIRKEDVLCIDILQKVAEELGTNLAGIINTFNPEMLVIGGDLSVTGDYLIQPISMDIKKYSLNLVNKDSRITLSTLREKAGLTGACLMARNRFLNG